MSDLTGKYRSLLDKQHSTARQLVMDEIEGEVLRLLEYTKAIDKTNDKAMQDGYEYITEALEKLAQELY